MEREHLFLCNGTGFDSFFDKEYHDIWYVDRKGQKQGKMRRYFDKKLHMEANYKDGFLEGDTLIYDGERVIRLISYKKDVAICKHNL